MYAEILFCRELCKCVESEPPANHCREIFLITFRLAEGIACNHSRCPVVGGAKPGKRDAAAKP
jgi:hypothetical protein